MKRLLLACTALLLAVTNAQAEGFVHADHQQIIGTDGKPLILRGMGLGGWMIQEGYMLNVPNLGAQHVIRNRISEIVGPEKTERFYQSWRDNAVTKADIEAMASWGFNSVRLPMHWNLFIHDRPGKVEWNPEGFRRLDQLIGCVKVNHMVLILDLHAAPGGQGNDLAISDRDPKKPSLWESGDNQARMIELWTEIARRYKTETAIAGYDLLNEPNWGFQDKADTNGCKETGNKPLRDLYERTIRAIRAVDTNHMLIIEGNCWGSNYAGLLPISDRNTTLSFHKYWSNTTQDTIEPYLKLRTQYDMPLWNGESGENSNDWFAHAVALEETNGIGWAWWPLKKVGFNNPLEITAGPYYRNLARYLRGEGEKPRADVAYDGLMQLAAYSRFDHNIWHPDVIDALFRSAHTDEPAPFRDHRITREGGVLEAVEYDLGKDGFAYHDTVSGNYYLSTGGPRQKGNDGGTYRNDGVDIASSVDGFAISQMQPGEWVRYSFDSDGAYTLPVMIRAKGKGTLTLALNDGTEQAVTISSRDWSQTTAPTLSIKPGRNVLIVKSTSGSPDFSALTFRPQ